MNLLQPQDRRSRAAGDRREAVEGRAALERAGVGQALMEEVRRIVHPRLRATSAVVTDLGCGTGAALATLAESGSTCAIGIDLSVAALALAARRVPTATWVAANADRRLPLLDASVDVLLSLHGRRPVAECARVLRPSGVLIVAVPAPDDLIELRTAVQGHAPSRDRVPVLVAEHAPFFTAEAQTSVRTRHRLERPELLALLGATYRGARTSASPYVDALSVLDVTIASNLCVLVPRGAAAGVAPAARA